MYYTLEPLSSDDTEPSNGDGLTFKPSVRATLAGYKAIVTIANSDGKDIVLAMAHGVRFKTRDEAVHFANHLATVVSRDVMASYERYLETGEEP